MTIKQISEKYNVPYALVYEATGNVKIDSNYWHNREYPEREVVKNIKKILEKRIDKSQKKLDEATQMLSYVKWMYEK